MTNKHSNRTELVVLNSNNQIAKIDLTPFKFNVARAVALSLNDTSSLLNFDSGEKEKFATDVANTVANNDFLEPIIKKLGDPMPKETEQEFVARGVKLLREALYKKFNLD